ncbi:hypothetical protein BGZ94_004893 [Podila epigama]|nr:hypothetical protein BGZ94_004893 [Podila epigama]
MSFASRSFSTSSLSSRLSSSSLYSQYSASSERSLSASPGPATPCDMMSRSPSFSQERIAKSVLPMPLKLCQQQPSTMPASFPPPQRFSHSSQHPHAIHAGQQQQQQQQQPQHYGSASPPHQHASIPHTRSQQQQYHGHTHPYHASHSQQQQRQHPSSPRDQNMFTGPLSSPTLRDHADYHHNHQRSNTTQYERVSPAEYNHTRVQTAPFHYHHHQQQQQQSHHHHPQQYHHHPYHPRSMSPTPLSPAISVHDQAIFSPRPAHVSSFSHHTFSSSTTNSNSNKNNNSNSNVSTPMGHEGRRDYFSSMSRSPSVSSEHSMFSRDNSPFGSENDEYVSPASASMTSLSSTDSQASMATASSSSSSSSSSSPAAPSPNPSTTTSTNTQLLLCPVCSRAFKPSKNQNCNLRRHLKNVHNMSPTMHPRKCKWDSLPDGRVKDDKDRKERTRKSKRLWARKFRLRRKVEEAAVVLSMLSQAV